MILTPTSLDTKCEICHGDINPENPAKLVVVIKGSAKRKSHIGANVHLSCLTHKRVVGTPASKLGFLSRLS